jgi:hypothetical protein
MRDVGSEAASMINGNPDHGLPRREPNSIVSDGYFGKVD